MKEICLFIGYLKSVEKFAVLTPERVFLMMGFLGQHVLIDIVYLRLAIRKSPIALLPFKPVGCQVMVIDEFG